MKFDFLARHSKLRRLPLAKIRIFDFSSAVSGLLIVADSGVEYWAVMSRYARVRTYHVRVRGESLKFNSIKDLRRELAEWDLAHHPKPER